MLFTDAICLQQNDLLRVDSEISDIASTVSPAIALTDVITDAQDEVGSQLLGFGGRFHGRWTNLYNGPEYGVQSIFTESANRPRFSLSQIVVTDAEYPAKWSDLKRFLSYVTLYNFYRDASRRAGKQMDRYAEKRDMYLEEIRGKYQPRLIKAGMPVVGQPMARPGALWEYGSGTWAASNLSLVSGGSGISSASYDVAITWQDTGAAINNESAPSDTLTIAVPAGDRVQISIANLTAPNGAYRLPSVARIPVNSLTARVWNVYAALTGQPLTLQASVPYATKTYNLDIPTTTGVPIGVGQYPDLFMTVQPNLMMRA